MFTKLFYFINFLKIYYFTDLKKHINFFLKKMMCMMMCQNHRPTINSGSLCLFS